ncbi:UNVERIFIED_CONTAM: hypothetical protein HDU68_010741, partial [Siphonaria sp. JEL0065]
EDSETTSDDEILRIKIPKKKVLNKRQPSFPKIIPKKAPIGPERPRYNNRPVPVTPPVVINPRTSVVKETFNLSKVKVIDKGGPGDTTKADSLRHITKALQATDEHNSPAPPPSQDSQKRSNTGTYNRTNVGNNSEHSSPTSHHSPTSFKIKSLAPGVFYKPISHQHGPTGCSVEGCTVTTTARAKAGWVEAGNYGSSPGEQPVLHTLSLKISSQDKLNNSRIRMRRPQSVTGKSGGNIDFGPTVIVMPKTQME